MMDAPQYRNARWGLYVADRATGAPLYDLNGGRPDPPRLHDQALLHRGGA